MRRGGSTSPSGSHLADDRVDTSVTDAALTRLETRISSLLGSDRFRTPVGREAAVAELIVEPENEAEISDLVRMCESEKIALAPLGSARTLEQIRRTRLPIGVSLRRLLKIVAYEPDDMTIVAQAGITIAELNTAVSLGRQRLPVDPCNPELTTLGALIGASQAGPLRLSEGTSRDLLIGIRFVGHGGSVIQGGGRVVKNVAGYDLMKVMNGAFGTLGIVTEATFKVRPIPQEYCLARLQFERTADAFAVATRLHNALAMAHLEILSPALSMASPASENFELLAGFCGSPLEIGYQAEKIRELLGAQVEILDDDRALRIYEHLRDLDLRKLPLAAQIATPLSRLASAIERCGGDFRAHAGSGVAQIAANHGDVTNARVTIARWRKVVQSEQGHLRILSAPSSIRDNLEMFDSPSDGALNLMRRLKASFDPAGIFNPGCFVGGI
jgi:glycolate oxidase FAD binding subunit